MKAHTILVLSIRIFTISIGMIRLLTLRVVCEGHEINSRSLYRFNTDISL